MKTKTTKSQVRDLVMRVREGLGRASGKDMASREATARVVRCSPGSIYNYEHGLAKPGARMLEALERAANGGHAGKIDPDQLATMLHAIAKNPAAARATFERAMEIIA